MGVRATHEPGGVVRLERCEIAESPPRAEALGVLLEEARAFRKARRTSATVDRFVDGGGIRPARPGG